MEPMYSFGSNGQDRGLQGIPSTPGSSWFSPWLSGTLSTYSHTPPTPMSASSGVISARATSTPTGPWTHHVQLPQEHIDPSGYSPRQSEQLSAPSQDSPVDGFPPLPTAPKAVVSSVATHDASEKRRKAERRFPCRFAGCNSTFTRKVNLTGEPCRIIVYIGYSKTDGDL